MTTLKRYKLRSKVSIELTDLAVQACWSDDGSTAAEKEGWLRDPRLESLGWRRITAGAATSSLPAVSYDAHRLALAVPDGIRDADERCFLLEMGYDQLHGVSFSKGCFIGQEPTARMHYRKVLRKGFFAVQSLEDTALPPAGTPIYCGESRIGEMRSGCGAIGLAFARHNPWHKAQESAAPMQASGVAVSLQIPAYMHRKWDSILTAGKNAM